MAEILRAETGTRAEIYGKQSHEIFDLWFFRQTIPMGPRIHGLKRF
jgi:hypothetical protein